jgi:DNA-binding winged helix-turn-helix (wHTH) protein/tetratricopeptide (TPR) repeat protein
MRAATELCHSGRPTPFDTMRPVPAIVRPAPARYRFGLFEFDTAKRELRRDRVLVKMPARVFECLEHLIAQRERAVGHDELSQAVFHRPDVSDGQLAQIVVRARRCVDDDGRHQRVIRTVPRYGYRWMADTIVVENDCDPVPADATEVPGPAPSRPEPRTALGEPRPHRRRPLLALALLVIATGVSLAWTLRPGHEHRVATPAADASGSASAATLVLPTKVASDDPADLAWARLGLMDFLAERLRLAGLSVPPSESTLILLGTDPDASEPGQLHKDTGAALIVSSHVRRDGAGWRVELAAEAVDGVRYDGAAVDAELLQAARTACDHLLAALGHDASVAGLPALDLDERLQRVKAAMLANELDSARRILLAAPANQLDRPQLRYRLAQIDYRAGDFIAAETTLDSLLAAPEAAADPLFRARLLIARGGVRFRRTALGAAERDFDAALEALRGDAQDLETGQLETGQALNGRGVARAALGREAQGIADLGAARLHLLRAGDRIAVARTDANLGVIEMTRGRPAQALEYFTSALAVFERSSAVHERLVTLSALTAVHLQRLDPEAALTSADRALQLLPRTSDPTLRLAAHLDRANALIALGRFGEARVLLDDPAIAATTTPAYEQRRAQTRIELALRSGDARAAAALADAALEHWQRLPGDDVHDWVRLRRVQAAQAADLPPAGAAEVSGTDGRTLPVLLATALLREGDAAEPVLREALALAEQRSAPAELVEVARVYVPWLIGRDRLQEAGVLVGRLAPWAEHCYDCALLQWQLADALGEPALADEARGQATRLAGERPRPSGRPVRHATPR